MKVFTVGSEILGQDGAIFQGMFNFPPVVNPCIRPFVEKCCHACLGMKFGGQDKSFTSQLLQNMWGKLEKVKHWTTIKKLPFGISKKSKTWMSNGNRSTLLSIRRRTAFIFLTKESKNNFDILLPRIPCPKHLDAQHTSQCSSSFPKYFLNSSTWFRYQ